MSSAAAVRGLYRTLTAGELDRPEPFAADDFVGFEGATKGGTEAGP
jgi:hypothetical protein